LAPAHFPRPFALGPTTVSTEVRSNAEGVGTGTDAEIDLVPRRASRRGPRSACGFMRRTARGSYGTRAIREGRGLRPHADQWALKKSSGNLEPAAPMSGCLFEEAASQPIPFRLLTAAPLIGRRFSFRAARHVESSAAAQRPAGPAASACAAAASKVGPAASPWRVPRGHRPRCAPEERYCLNHSLRLAASPPPTHTRSLIGWNGISVCRPIGRWRRS
jgi:hypothetical protein